MTQNTEQNVRTRDEQAKELTATLQEDPWMYFPAQKYAEEMIQEAEARGAEEQRQKDAEGQKPVAWRAELALAIDTETGKYCGWEWRISEREFCVPEGSIRNLSALYSGPVNLAAMQAEIAALKEAEQLARADAEASKVREEKLSADLVRAERWSEVAHQSCMGTGPKQALGETLNGLHQFLRAALTREGGA